MDKYCERCYARDAKPCMECSTCNPGHRNFRPMPTPGPTHAARMLTGLKDVECLCELLWDGPDDSVPDFSTKQELLDWLRQPSEE